MTGFEDPKRDEQRRKQAFEVKVSEAIAAWELADEAFDSRHRAAHVIVEVKGGAMRQNPTLVAGVVEELGSRMPSFAEAAGQLGTWNKTEVEAGTLWARETPVVRENYSYRLVHEQLDSEGRLAEERVLLVPAAPAEAVA